LADTNHHEKHGGGQPQITENKLHYLVSFDKLRRLEAFLQFERELYQALAKMCIIAE
jgi:hypothetical protein